MKKIFIAIPLLIWLVACNNKNDAESGPRLATLKPPAVQEIALSEPVGRNADASIARPKSAAGNIVLDTSRKVIREGDISFETSDIAGTRKKIISVLKNNGGYVDEDNEALNNDSYKKEYTLKVRIPAKNFDAFLDSVSANAAHVDSKHIMIADVTTQFIDITSRLNNKKLLENQYLDLLKKASKMADVLEVEDKLNEIRTDIESTQGQLNYLNKQIAYSSLQITFYTKTVTQAAEGNGFGYRFKGALGDGFSFLADLFFRIIALWPLWLLVFIAYIGIARIRKKRKNKASSNQ